jgi:hypothetical protein
MVTAAGCFPLHRKSPIELTAAASPQGKAVLITTSEDHLAAVEDFKNGRL